MVQLVRLGWKLVTKYYLAMETQSLSYDITSMDIVELSCEIEASDKGIVKDL